MSCKMSEVIPSELRLSKKWDVCAERMFIHVATGAVVAGLASVVLFRTSSGRAKGTLFGIGVGVGNAWAKCSMDFQQEKQDST
mmetsp:Transcript_6114/g.9226  ORF Transcript_6114/g.9226 Transcript_6114/m.9226 type:complete len:83 (+) Transcript_6114:77-325(+)